MKKEDIEITETQIQTQSEDVEDSDMQLSNKKRNIEKIIQKKKDGNKNKEKPKFSWPIYKKLLKYTQKQWKFAFMGFSFTIITGVLNALMPLKTGQILDAIGINQKQDKSQFINQFIVLALLMLFIVVGSLIRTIFMKLLQQRIAIDMRVQVFKKLIGNDIKFFEQYKSGQFVSRLGSDISLAKSAITNNLNELLKSIVTTFGNLIMLLVINWKLSIPILLMVPIYGLFSTFYTKRNKILTKKHRDIMAQMAAHIAQKFGGIQIIKAFCTQDFQSQKYIKINERSYQVIKKRVFLRSFYVTCSELLPKIATLIAIYFGGYLIFEGLQDSQFTIGKLTSFILYCAALNSNVSSMSKGYSNIINGTQAVQKVFQMLNYQPQVDQTDEGNQDKFKVSLNGEITFQNVSFSYPKHNVKVLNNINFKINQGEYVAIVGQSGSGKSTIIKVIQRFYHAKEGLIKIGNHLQDMISIKSLRSQISFVNQQATLFSGTIEENITYGLSDYSYNQIEKAAKQSGCYDFISNQKKFPFGFKTEIGQKGSQLSGGQRQRIAIARALIRNPKILILDQATSALDTNSQALVQKSIENISNHYKKMTIIVIAHRLSTVKNARRIIVMKDGQIKQIGNHKQLKHKKGYYYDLIQKQLSEQDGSIKQLQEDSPQVSPQEDETEESLMMINKI